MKTIKNPFHWVTFVMAAIKLFLQIFDCGDTDSAFKKNGFNK